MLFLVNWEDVILCSFDFCELVNTYDNVVTLVDIDRLQIGGDFGVKRDSGSRAHIAQQFDRARFGPRCGFDHFHAWAHFSHFGLRAAHCFNAVILARIMAPDEDSRCNEENTAGDPRDV